MGKQTKSNMGLNYRTLHIMLKEYEFELADVSTSPDRARWIIMCGTFFVIGFVLALRGNEGLLVEAHGLLSHLHYGTEAEKPTPFILVPLLGRFKGEEGERWHLMMSVSKTQSGFEVRKWVERLAAQLRIENNVEGPAFCNRSGTPITYGDIDEEFQSQLEKIQILHPNLIEPSLNVREWFSIFRSLRKGSTARAAELDISDQVVNLHNRWRATEGLRGARSTRSMRDYYTSLKLSQ